MTTKEDKIFANKYIRRFYRAIKNDPKLRVKIFRGMQNTDFDDFKDAMPRQISGIHKPTTRSGYKININPDWSINIIGHIIHELLHEVEADKDEGWVEATTKELQCIFTDMQLTNLMKKVWR